MDAVTRCCAGSAHVEYKPNTGSMLLPPSNMSYDLTDLLERSRLSMIWLTREKFSEGVCFRGASYGMR